MSPAAVYSSRYRWTAIPHFRIFNPAYRAQLTLDERLEEIGIVGGDRDIAGERAGDADVYGGLGNVTVTEAETQGPHLSNRPMGMPSYELSPDQQEILDQVDRFAKDVLHPLSQRMDDEEWWPDEVFPRLGDNSYDGMPIGRISSS